MSRLTLLLACMVLGCDPAADLESDAALPGKADDPERPIDVAAPDFVGVLPDFAPASGVKVHVLLDALAPDLDDALTDALGAGVRRVTSGYQGPSGYTRAESMVWTRDYLPTIVRTATEDVVVASLSVNVARSGYTGSAWIPVAPPSPAHQWYRDGSGTGGRWLRTEVMPLLHEGGNVVATGRWLIVTDRLVRLNTEPSEGSDAAHLRRAGWHLRTADEVLDLFARSMRIDRDHLLVIPPMPGEKTDHADLVVMALGPDEVLVPELRDDILGIITYDHEIALAQRVRAYLDTLAATLTEAGLEVHRLPMLPAVYLEADPSEPTGWNGVFYSPTNALQLQRPGEARQVWLPRFEPTGFPEAYRQVADTYIAEWEAFFEDRDVVTHVVEATELGRAYGLFRCVSVPDFSSR
ncbi:MAG: hypothetical protein JNJ59_15290 [Deltaproteobacteria bacterium]|nr:hypothetical protein [Deltaproteobacteria bacterium]